MRGQLEYYATQIHEVDEFLRTLTDVLTTWEEPTVLVLYGDHMPSLEISKDMLDLSAGGLFETEYVIWSNCGVGGADRNVKAYQLSSRVLELLDINVGTLTKFHPVKTVARRIRNELRTRNTTCCTETVWYTMASSRLRRPTCASARGTSL